MSTTKQARCACLSEQKATLVEDSDTNMVKVQKQAENQMFDFDYQASSQAPEASARPLEERPMQPLANVLMDALIALTQAIRLSRTQ